MSTPKVAEADARRRSTARLTRLLVAMLLVALASAGWAEDEDEDETGRPAEVPEIPPEQAGRRPPRLSMTASVQPQWETNPRFTSTPPTADAGTRVRLDLSRALKRSRLDLRLNGGAGALVYRRETGLNQLTFGFNGAIDYRLTPRTTLRLNQSFYSDYAGDVRELADAGLLLGKVLTRTYLTRVELEQRLSARLTATAAGRFDLYTFDSSQPVTLENGSTAVARLGLKRASGRRDTLSASYEYRVQRSGGSSGDSHTALLGWTHKLTAHLELQLEAGASRMRPFTGTEWISALVGQGTLRGQLGRQTITLGLNRDVGQAYGLGITRLSNGARVVDDVKIARRLVVSLGAGLTRSQSEEASGEPFDSDTANVTLRWLHSRRMTSTVGYVLYRLASAATTLQDHRLTLGLAWANDWR